MNRKRNSNGKFDIKYEIEPELLESLYLGNQYNAYEIAKMFGCSATAIYAKLKKCGISCINNPSWYEEKYEIELELLWGLYWGEELPTEKIGKIFGCTGGNITRKMEEYGIPRRNVKDTNHNRKVIIPKEDLIKLYNTKDVSIKKISEIYDCSTSVINYLLKDYNIPTKPRIEYTAWNEGLKGIHLNPACEFKKGMIPWNKGKIILHELICKQCKIPFKNKNKKKLYCSPKCLTESRSKENSRFWKGGITSENNKLRRGKEFKKWRENVFKKDNWTCKICSVRGGKLHPHHIKYWAEYPELRFDIDNGVTLCEKCHYDIHTKNK